MADPAPTFGGELLGSLLYCRVFECVQVQIFFVTPCMAMTTIPESAAIANDM